MKFRTQEKYTNLVNLVLHVYKKLERFVKGKAVSDSKPTKK